MSGAVNTVKQAASSAVDSTLNIVKDIAKQPGKGLLEAGTAIFDGGLQGSILTGNTLAKAAGNVYSGDAVIPATSKAIGDTVQTSGIGDLLMGKQQLPNISVQDPSAVNAANASQRAAAARQAQIDQQTGAPGRGGTILTDNYNYRT